MSNINTFKAASTNEPNTTRPRTRRNRRSRGRVSESVVLDRRGRKVGSDDMRAAARIAKWAELSGIRGKALEIAAGLALAMEASVVLAEDGRHSDASKKAASCAYVLKHNDRIAELKVQCRDGKVRTLREITEWYSGVHFRISEEVKEQKAAEDEFKATKLRNALLKLETARAIKAAEEVLETKVA